MMEVVLFSGTWCPTDYVLRQKNASLDHKMVKSRGPKGSSLKLDSYRRAGATPILASVLFGATSDFNPQAIARTEVPAHQVNLVSPRSKRRENSWMSFSDHAAPLPTVDTFWQIHAIGPHKLRGTTHCVVGWSVCE